MTGRSDLVDIAGEIRHETKKGMLFFDGERQVWLPKSMVEDNRDGTVAMPAWLALERGLI